MSYSFSPILRDAYMLISCLCSFKLEILFCVCTIRWCAFLYFCQSGALTKSIALCRLRSLVVSCYAPFTSTTTSRLLLYNPKVYENAEILLSSLDFLSCILYSWLVIAYNFNHPLQQYWHFWRPCVRRMCTYYVLYFLSVSLMK